MYVSDWGIKEQADTVEVSANVDSFRLWYRLPKSYSVSTLGDPFLALALLPAMLKGEKLEVDSRLPVSPKYLENVFLLQEIFHSWNPELKMVPVSATTSPAKPISDGIFSFFSGGVDSTYTFLKRREEISLVVFIQGFDFFCDKKTYQKAIERNTRFIQSFGKTLIPVETNYYPFGYRYNLSRNITQGSCLGGVALLLGFSRVYVPASYSYNQLFPLGSHPLLDHLWSNECVEIIHDGCEAGRTDKLKKICEFESALANLMVCFNDMNVNCGKCAKCLRTMISLKLLNAAAPSFPPFPSLKTIRESRIAGDIEMAFLRENAELALQADDGKLLDSLCACMRRHEQKQVIKELDRVFLGGIIKQAYRRIVKDPPGVRRFDTTPPRD